MGSNIDTNRNHGLDMAKASAILIVLYWHLQPFEYKIVTPTIFTSAINGTKHFLNFEITPIAVPILFVVSFHFFLIKSSDEIFYFKKRLVRLFSISSFWITIQFLLFYLLQPMEIPYTRLLAMILIGGPDLPFVGGSVFYYLIVLIFSVAILYTYKRVMPHTIPWINEFLVLLSLIYFEYMNLTESNLPYWRIDSFLIYLPTALILKNNIHRLMKAKYWFLSGYILFIFQDLYLGNFGGNQSHYGRISIYFGAIFLFLLCNSRKPTKSKICTFLSKFTLGIFALHKYWMLLLLILFNELYSKYRFPLYIETMCCQLHWLYFIVSILTIAFTLVSVYILSLTPLKRFVC